MCTRKTCQSTQRTVYSFVETCQIVTPQLRVFREERLRKQQPINSHHHKPHITNMQARITQDRGRNDAYLDCNVWNPTSGANIIRTQIGQNNRNLEIELVFCEKPQRRSMRSLFRGRGQRRFTSARPHKTERDTTCTVWATSKQSY